MTYFSVCSGVEAASQAWETLGWKPIGFAEIEPFPSAVLAAHYPDVPNFGDMTKIKVDAPNGVVTNGETKAQIPELLVGGTPCFVAGTMVLTPKGYVPIETLKVGDDVVSHLGNVRKVEAVGHKEARVGEFKVLGTPPVVCTPDHKFYSVKMKRDCRRKSLTYSRKIPCGDYSMVAAKDSIGRYVGRVPEIKVEQPTLPTAGTMRKADIVELAGWYVGDGYIRKWSGKTKKAVIIALVSKKKINRFKERFDGLVNFTVGKDGKVTIYCTELANWLVENFGELSHAKRIPCWLRSGMYADTFLEGYYATDGPNGANYSTVSKALAFGIADLIGNVSVCFHKTAGKHIIEGREVNQRDCWVVEAYKDKTPRTKFINGRYASIARSYTDYGTTRTVYNITVGDDHGYIVEGKAVSNCQSFSVAGKREGLRGLSGLALDYVRLSYELAATGKTQWLVWENVPGVFSSDRGRDFATFLSHLVGYEVGVPKDGWKTSGVVKNRRPDRWGLAWRVLDTQYVRVDGFEFAIPQRRRRVFVVGCFGDWTRAARVLFERDGDGWDTPPRREKVEEVARRFGMGNQGADGVDDCAGACVRAYENHAQDSRVKELQGACNSLRARDGTGGNNLPIVAHLSVSPDVAGCLAAADYKGVQNQKDTNGGYVVLAMDRASFNQGQNAQFAPQFLDDGSNPSLTAKGPSGVCLTCASRQQSINIGDNLATTISAIDYKEPQVVCLTPNCYPSVIKTITRRCDGGINVGGNGAPFVCLGIDRWNQAAQSESMPTLRTTGGTDGNDATPTVCLAFNCQGGSQEQITEEVTGTITAATNSSGNNKAVVAYGLSLDVRKDAPMQCEVSQTETVGTNPGHKIGVVTCAYGIIPCAGQMGMNNGDECSQTMGVTHDIGAVIYGYDGYNQQLTGDVAKAVTSAASNFHHVPCAIFVPCIVRRLTPTECERLMGFQDGWTAPRFSPERIAALTPFFIEKHYQWAVINGAKNPRRKTAAQVAKWLAAMGTPEQPDAPRYKACGNSMSTNVMRWLGEGINDLAKAENTNTNKTNKE